MDRYHGRAPSRPPLKIWADTPVHRFTVNAESSFLISTDELDQLHNGISIENGPLRKVAHCTWTQLKEGNVGRTIICQDGMPEPPKINSRAWVVTPAERFGEPMSEKLVVIQGPDVEKHYGQDAIVLVPFKQAHRLAEGMSLKDVHKIITGGFIASERPGKAQLTLRSTGPRTVETVY